MKKGYFAGGCFWGVEHYLQRIPGVISVVSGYMGGEEENPTYQQVKAHLTGHAQTVQVEYDENLTDYETIARMFFEIHDPTQVGHQGIDYGPQYRSEIFYVNEEQKQIAERLIAILVEKGYEVATKVTPASVFWRAEEYHQDYFEHNEGEPDCHFYTKRF